jgi:hypothetical protein
MKREGKSRIEYMALGKLREARRNPKLHDIEETIASIRRFGFVQVPAIDEKTGLLVAGHGRREALLEMKQAGEPVPKNIEDRDGEWFVPVLRGVAFETETEAEAYLLADNRVGGLAGYDDAMLAKMAFELAKVSGDGTGLVGTGIDPKTYEDLQAQLGRFEASEAAPPDLPDGDRQPLRQMTIIVHDDQHAIVVDAIARAKEQGGGESELNGNTSGNAIAWICKRFLDG